LFNLAAAASLLLCLIAASSWFAGLRQSRLFSPYDTHDGWDLTIFSERGTFTVMFAPTAPEYARPANFNSSRHELFYQVKAWKITLALGALPMAWIVVAAAGAIFRHRVRLDHCPHCGYNLTGNISGTCPECGTSIPQKSNISH
jgi:hypothetical protein